MAHQQKTQSTRKSSHRTLHVQYTHFTCTLYTEFEARHSPRINSTANAHAKARFTQSKRTLRQCTHSNLRVHALTHTHSPASLSCTSLMMSEYLLPFLPKEYLLRSICSSNGSAPWDRNFVSTNEVEDSRIQTASVVDLQVNPTSAPVGTEVTWLRKASITG